MNSQKKKLTRSRDFDSDLTIGPDATIGDKVKAIRLSKRMTLTGLSRACGLSERALRYIENNERQPSVDAIKKISAALEVGTDFFIEDDIFQQEVQKEEVLQHAKELYGTHGMAQAHRLYESARGLYAGGKLNEAEREEFRDLMMELFFETKEEAKKYTPKKYRKSDSNE